MVPNREITSLISTKTSYEAMMKTVTKDTYFKSMLGTLRNYKKQMMIYHSYQKKEILVNAKDLCVTCMTRKICHTHKIPGGDTRL